MLVPIAAIAFLHLWTHVDRGWFLALPTTANGIVYEGTTLGSVLALDERDGRVLWQRALEPAMSFLQAIGTPASSGRTVVVPLFHNPRSGELVALRVADGAIEWRTQTPGIYGAPVIWRGTLLAAEAKGVVAAFDLRTGQQLAALPSLLDSTGTASRSTVTSYSCQAAASCGHTG